jgi:hypothetical protein
MSKTRTGRKERIELMQQMLKEEFADTKEDSINYDTFIAKFCIRTGVSQRTAREYITLLSQAGLVNVPPIQLVTNPRILRS